MSLQIQSYHNLSYFDSPSYQFPFRRTKQAERLFLKCIYHCQTCHLIVQIVTITKFILFMLAIKKNCLLARRIPPTSSQKAHPNKWTSISMISRQKSKNKNLFSRTRTILIIWKMRGRLGSVMWITVNYSKLGKALFQAIEIRNPSKHCWAWIESFVTGKQYLSQ